MTRASLSVGAFALLVSGIANAVEDECDLGGGYLSGDLPMAAADTVWQPFGPATQPNVGRWVAVADFNGDGAMDLAMAADGTDINGANAGAVYVQLSPSDKFDGAASASLNDIDVALYGASAGDHTGFRIANAGDVDDDGLDDLLIGSAPSGGISLGAGVAYLVLGSTLVTSTEIDLATQADATFFGQFNGDSFGYRLTGLGDVNGDGYSDILIGAPFYKASGAGRGAAYLFLGPLTGDKFAGTDEDVKFEGAINGGNFGTTVTRLGDVNGDTLTDFGIGAINDGTTGSNAGAFYVYHGRSSFPTSMAATAADWRLYGRQYERCGSSAVALGDTNNDGFGDFAVGCYLSGSFKTGLVHLFRGQAGNQVESMHVRHDYVIWGLYANDTVGGQIDAGDLDNDGQIDLVVSGSKAQGTVAQSGAAWGFYGPFPLGGGRSVAQADMKFRGQAYQDNFAYGIAVGDVNNDDYADVIIGTPNSDAFSNEGGFAALYRGGEDGADLKTFYYDGDGDGFGGMTAVQACAAPPFHVALGGDCNDADGLYRPGAEEACDGIDYNCDGVAGTVPTDLDADGVPSCGPNTAPVDCDDNDPDIAPGLDELCGDLKDNNCDGGIDDGSSIDAVIYYPDVDQDGFGDENNGQASCEEPEFAAATLTIGGDCDDIDPYVNPNAVEVCGDGIDNDCANGPDDPDAVNAPTWFADVDGDSFGDPNSRISSCVQPLGYSADRLDCNDSASSVNPAATETCDFVDNDCNGMDYLGGPHSLNEAFSSFTGKRGGDQLFAAGFLKDQDFDGDDEAIFAAIGNDDGAVAGGAVYIRRGEYAGGHFDMGVVYNDGSGDWDVKIVGDRKDALFGSSVASGDINGDGVADLLVGAPGARVPDIDQGAIYVFFGPIADGSFTMSDADAIIKGEKDKNSRFGARVTVQDVTNDGIADILASAPEYTGTLNKQGKVYLILGTLSPLPAEDFAATLARSTFVGSANNERIGAPLASLGDIDDDDYNDFIVGAPSYGALRRGAAYVFYGRAGFASGAITYDARITGDADGDTFATAVSDVGDVNADGFRDMVFGTTVNRAYLVYGSATRLTNGPISGVTAIRFTAAAGLRAGATVGRLGDINQDGHADFAIGAPDYDESFTVRDVGRMYVVFGKADYTEIVPLGGSFNLDTLESFGRILPGDLDNFPTYSAVNFQVLEGGRVDGIAASDAFASVTSGGDYDGDGVPDVIFSAALHDRSPLTDDLDTGKAWMFLGGAYGDDVFVSDGSEDTWYWDSDADLFTNDNNDTFVSCAMHLPITFDFEPPRPRGYLLPQAHAITGLLDCDDNNRSVFPGADEYTTGDPLTSTDGVDSDCDGYDIPNVLPTLTLDLTPDLPLSTDTLVANVVVTDNDPIFTTITLEYEWIVDGSTLDGQSGSTLLATPTNFVAGDQVTVRVRANDTRGVTDWYEDTVVIANTPPVLGSCNIIPTVAGVTTDFSSNYSGLNDDDPVDAGNLTVLYQWQKYSSSTGIYRDIPLATASTRESCVDTYDVDEPGAIGNCVRGSQLRLCCTPRDLSQNGTPVCSAPVVIQNTPPEMTECSITPTNPYTNEILSAVIDAEDFDIDDDVDVDLEWFVNGTSTATTPSLGSASTRHFDTIYVQCTPRDDHGGVGTTVTSSTVTVLNSPPGSLSINLTGTVHGELPWSNEDIRVDVTTGSVDIDLDPITEFFYWTRNGDPGIALTGQPSPTTVDQIPDGLTFKGDVWAVEAEPSDGFSVGPRDSDSILIRNTPPTLVSVSIDPAFPESRSVLTALPNGYADYDVGDVNLSQYEWYVQTPPGGALLVAGETGPTLPKQFTKRGDYVYVVAKAYDGESYGDTRVSTQVLVGNSPPEAPTLLAMSPVPASEFDQIECAIAPGGLSYDEDSDNVTYTVTFVALRRANPFAVPPETPTEVIVKSTVGVGYVASGAAWVLDPDPDPFDGDGDTLGHRYGDEILCRVTPSDAFDEGPTAEPPANVSIQDLTAPPAPTMKQIERYRNGETGAATVTLEGSCAAFPTECGNLWVNCYDDTGALLYNSGGPPVEAGDPPAYAAPADCIRTVPEDPYSAEYSVDVSLTNTLGTLPYGRDWTCYTFCSDIDGNRSLNSTQRTTQVCNPFDDFDFDGVGNTWEDAANGDDGGPWATLLDNNATTVSMTGNIVGSGVEFTDTFDWYVVTTEDNRATDITAGQDKYNAEITMSTSNDRHRMFVYRDDGAPPPPGQPGVLQCPLVTGGVTSFNWYNYDQGDYTSLGHPHHGTVSNPYACSDYSQNGGANAPLNDCNDYDANFYIRVGLKTGAPKDCSPYTITVTNGDPTHP